MAGTRKLSIEILGNAKGALGALDDVGSKAGKIGGKLADFGKKAFIGIAAGGAGAAVVAAKLISAGETAATSNARISQIATSMNLFGKGTENAGTSVADLTDRLTGLAEKTAMATGVDQNQIKLTQAKLLTFKNLATTADETGGAFDRATQAAIDMGAAGFGDAATNAVQLGKALQDPVKGITALSKSGITFTNSEKDLIKAMVNTGKAGDAQNMILKAIEAQVGGTSVATANASDKMKVAFSILQEKLGQKLLPVFEKLSNFVINKLIPGIEGFVNLFQEKGLKGVLQAAGEFVPKITEKLKQFGTAFVQWIKEAYPPALKALLGFVYDVGQWLQNTGLPWVAKKLQEGAQALWEWIQKAAPPALKRLGELIGKLANWLLDEGLPMLVEKLVALGNAFVEWIKPNIVPMLEKLGELLLAILTWIVTEAVPKIAEQAVKLVGALLGWVAQLLPEVLSGLGKFIVELVKKIPGLFVSLVSTMWNVGTSLGGALLGALIDALKGLGEKGLAVGKSFANGIIRFINNNVIRKINDLLDFKISALGVTVHINPPDIPPIPELAAGGVVRSPTLALIGEAGPEAVIPLSRGAQYGVGPAGSGGPVVNITVTSADPQEVVKALQRYTRNFGKLPAGIV